MYSKVVLTGKTNEQNDEQRDLDFIHDIDHG